MSKTLRLGHAEHAKETLARSVVVVANRSVLFLARSVENVDEALLPVQNNLFAVRICLCRIVLFNEIPV